MSRSLFRTKKIDTILSDAASSNDDEGHHSGLKRVLTVRDLTFFGIAAILGAGSFSSLGSAVFSGGPGVVILFIICGIACAFTAFCYSEFASRIPVAGSAYTYAYASFGELFAWMIGWALLMEYSIGNIYVAFSWSDYFTSFLERVHVHVPDFLTCSYKEAQHAFNDYSAMNAIEQASFTAKKANVELLSAWNNAPLLGSLKMILDVPALIINLLITYLVYRGIKESRNFSNAMVILKLAVVILIICVGGYFVFADGLTANWMPASATDAKVHSFMPNGFGGVMLAVSSVFFAYIGFDAVSVLAEESKNPQRDLPRGMILSLVICTGIYILLALVLTGAVIYTKFENVGDPLAFIFEPENLNLPWMQFLVSICAVIAMTSVLLVFQMGQPRIWMSMSRDGLLPPIFQRIHPKFKTPSFATILTGLVVGVPILFTDKTFVLDFTSIATLFAFVLVCGGVLLIPRKEKVAGRFNMPFINSQLIYPLLIIGAAALLYFLNKNGFGQNYFQELFNGSFADHLQDANAADYIFPTMILKLSSFIFWIACVIIACFAIVKKWSLIPLMGLTSCLYLLTGMSASNWIWFIGWLALGLIIYLLYGYRKSKLAS